MSNSVPKIDEWIADYLRLCLVSRVVSMGRRNTFLKFTRRSLKT
jgi:hypothetical protein